MPWTFRRTPALAAALFLVFAAVAGAAPVRHTPPSKLYDIPSSHLRADRVVVKFAEGSDVRLRGGALVSAAHDTDLRALRSWLSAHPGITVSRHFARPEADLDRDRAEGERRGGGPLADLNLYVEFHLRDVSERDAALAALRGMPLVELAFVEPVPEPATLEAGEAVTTPDYSGQQGYLYASPSGINAQAVWGYPGGRGANVKICDIEGAWLWTHEDLRTPFFTGGTPIDDLGWRNHGTAVMGVMNGANNGFGVTGIAADMQAGGVSIGDLSVAAAIDLASANLSAGDLFLIELHAAGPNSGSTGQFGYVPMEFWQDNFDAIQTAVANGRICIEAGGNGSQNLDDPVYRGLFDRTLRYSGAIMVGAGTPAGVAESWSNNGSRLDLNGWGEQVTTCGYGNLQGGAETQWYTSTFNGTSSASPVVAGAVACLEGMCEAQWGIPLSGPLASQILYQTGTPWTGNRIGKRPDLVAARTLLLQGIGIVTGTVRDLASGQPIPNADVLFVEPGVLVRSDGSGHYENPVLSGSYTVRASEFFHVTGEQAVSVSSGQTLTHDISLSLKPTGTVSGIVLDQNGAAIPGVQARILDVPLAPATSGASGHYAIPGVPAASGYQAIFGLVPGRGAAARTFDISAGATTTANAMLVPAETFESGPAGFTGDAPWERGAPSVVGPAAAFSGTSLWGTNLSGNYADNVTAYLTSGSYNFSGAAKLFLSFTQWYDTEPGFDGGEVQVWSGGAWQTVVPAGGYPLDFLAGLAFGSGYSGLSNGWQPAVFDLTPYISSDVRIRFWFGSDPGVNGPGWYIDDVAFDVRSAAVSAETPGIPVRAMLRAGAPNPFSAATSLAFELPSAATIELRVYDTAGRLVRVLASGRFEAGAHAARWDGRDSGGRPVASGTYFAELEADGRKAGSQRLLLVR